MMHNYWLYQKIHHMIPLITTLHKCTGNTIYFTKYIFIVQSELQLFTTSGWVFFLSFCKSLKIVYKRL